MNKSALKTFATSARKELLKKVEAKALKIGITEETIKKADVESSDAIFIDGRQLSKEEKTQRDKLITRINQIGFKQVMEEVAYTWFNRFTALRFMEVNDYLPSGVRVLSSSNPNSADPDMLNEALELDLEVELDKEHIYNLKLNNETEELFKYLIIKHCNDLNRFLPFMFEKIDDYTEILFPEGLLAKESFIRQMTDIEFIPEDDWKKVEIVGWLYQYYIAEEKDRVIKAKKKYKTEEIPFATQLFTPNWIVRYMVQNSLGRYWIESHPEDRDLLNNWEFYLENPNPEPDFEEKLSPYINKALKVEDIKCFDPAMGSGHILVYMFDVLYEIYSKCGYMEREIPRLIIENNLYGLDIDDRAYQLACFSVVMKALEYNSRFFSSIERDGLTINLASIQETNVFTDENVSYLAGEKKGENYDNIKEFVEQFKNAKSIGSLIKVNNFDYEYLNRKIEELQEKPIQDLFEYEIRDTTMGLFKKILHQAKIMIQKYDLLISNPPYAGNKYLTKEVIDYLKQQYPDTKSDLFSAFMEYSSFAVKENGQIGFITPYVWMFISSYEKLRQLIVSKMNISSLVQLEYNAFPEATVPVCTFSLRNYSTDLNGEYVKLSEFPGVDIQQVKLLEAIENSDVPYRYTISSKEFSKISGSPIAYWVSERVLNIFTNSINFGTEHITKKGMFTGDNALFLRNWYEINSRKIGSEFRFYNKGGGYRKWYGFKETVINWKNNGEEVKNFKGSGNINEKYFYKPCISWNLISSTTGFSARFIEEGFVMGDAGPTCFFPNDDMYYSLGLLNSKVGQYFLDLLNPTINFSPGVIDKMPFIEIENKTSIEEKVQENIEITKSEWNSYETAFDFKKHPFLLVGKTDKIKNAFDKWSENLQYNYGKLKRNEEFLNTKYIEIYGLNNEMDELVNDETIIFRKADIERDVKSFISYFVGCVFGRYSLDREGVVFDGDEFNTINYKTFPVDSDNILPILPEAYFEDDIISRFVDFLKVTFGEATISENLEFVANVIGRKKGETPKEALRRYFMNDFFSDHIDAYSIRGRKAPIYWLFTSGKQKSFNCLIYMHRYDSTTLSRIRTDYLHEYQIRLDAEKKDLLNIIEGDYTTKEISSAKKELKVLERRIEELKEYDELLHHMADMQIEIDLDNGVVDNYEKFKGLVAKI